VVLAAEGTVTVPYLTGTPGSHAFTGRSGWVDVYHAGYGMSTSARIGPDGTFTLPDPDKSVCLIATFDKMETPAVILAHWPTSPGDHDVAIPVEYACVPEGASDDWGDKSAATATDFCQSIVAQGTQLYGLTLFDGLPSRRQGSKMHLCIHEGGPEDPLMLLDNHVSPDPMYHGPIDRVSSNRSAGHDVLRAGWRYGNVETTPGKTYTLRTEGFRSHGGDRWKLNAFVRPDPGDGYPDGEAFGDNKPLDGDLCCLVFGNSHGQLIENQVMADDWEVFLPRHQPSVDWGQTFVAHGVSLAGVVFWASAGDPRPVHCEVRVRREGPWGEMLKPAKVAVGHESPDRPTIEYPHTPAPASGFEDWQKLPCQRFQVAWQPDELVLTPGETYYVELVPNRPVLVYADGNCYKDGFAYYEGLKIDRQVGGKATFHSFRWTLLMDIITYARPGGGPLVLARRIERP
jgi:hypothetical protein